MQKIEANIRAVSMKIKTEDNIRKKDLDKYYQTLVDQINAELANVKKKVDLIIFTELVYIFFSKRSRSKKLQRSRKN